MANARAPYSTWSLEPGREERGAALVHGQYQVQLPPWRSWTWTTTKGVSRPSTATLAPARHPSVAA
eukprot:8004996-Lingulodinium_polyedra.AAC.1